MLRRAESDASQENRIPFRARILIYLAVWLVAALAFEAFLRPQGFTETDLTPLQQRLQWPFTTPLMVFFGLAQTLSTPRDIPQSFFWLCLAAFLAHAIMVLRCTQFPMFVTLIGLQAITLAVGVAHFVHFSRLPDGP